MGFRVGIRFGVQDCLLQSRLLLRRLVLQDLLWTHVLHSFPGSGCLSVLGFLLGVGVGVVVI